MERQKKKQKGITLIALVISIIVMLILAGVSLNATIGDNGIVTRAQEAALQHRIATELENLNLELAKMNVDTISTDETMAIQDIASYLISQGTIDGFVTTSAGQIAAGIDTTTGDKYFFGKKGDNTYRITRGTDGLLSAELTTQTSGGDITGGYALITADNFNNDSSLPEEEKGKFTITDDAEVVFMDTVSGSLSIKVNQNVHATVGIYADMTLTNAGISRSAIDIAPTGTLDLYIGEGVTLTVNSGLGLKGSGNDYQNINPGGYAGIRCISNSDGVSTLNLKGNGTVIAYGGDAADGNSYTGNSSSSIGGTGGGGAGAGIGGNGGYGSGYIVGKGASGGPGEDCGVVNLYNNVIVYAYGGAGGSGANGTVENGGGGGGYPAAGIGGGGAGAAGGTCCTAGGGYSGGGGDGFIGTASSGGNRGYGCTGGKNGGPGERVAEAQGNILNSGAGYFVEDVSTFAATLASLGVTTLSNGQGGFASRSGGHYAGDGGTAGKGGTVTVSETATVNAYNGNMYTDGLAGHEYNNGANQCPIYGQNGVTNKSYVFESAYRTSASFTILRNYNATGIALTEDYLNPTSNNKQGVGTGAGFYEVSNGTYIKDATLN